MGEQRDVSCCMVGWYVRHLAVRRCWCIASGREESRDIKTHMKKLEQQKINRYFKAVEADKRPQRYLYQVRPHCRRALRMLLSYPLASSRPSRERRCVCGQASKRPFRYYKIVQMVEKLALLIVTLYTPLDSKRWIRLAVATVVALTSSVVAVGGQPLGDVLEVTLDSTSRLTNLANAGISLWLDLNPLLSSTLVNVVLIGANGFNLAAFLFVLLGGPVRYVLVNRRFLTGQAVLGLPSTMMASLRALTGRSDGDAPGATTTGPAADGAAGGSSADPELAAGAAVPPSDLSAQPTPPDAAAPPTAAPVAAPLPPRQLSIVVDDAALSPPVGTAPYPSASPALEPPTITVQL